MDHEPMNLSSPSAHKSGLDFNRLIGAMVFLHDLDILLSREFAKEKARQQKSGEFHKIREKHMVEDAVKGYLDWINQAGKNVSEY